MNVLLLANMGPSEQRPNSGRFIQNQFESLCSTKSIDVEYFYLNQDPVGKIGKALRYPLFFLRFLKTFIFSLNKIDIIHVHFFYPTIFLAIAYKWFRNWDVKIVVTFHGSDIYHYLPPSRLYKFATRYIDHAIFVSKKLEERFFCKVPSSVMSAGILDLFTPMNVEKSIDLLFIGHVNKNKGIDRLQTLLEFPELKGLNVAIVGEVDCSQLPDLNDRIRSSLKGGVPPSELLELIHQSKFLISLSRNESFGLVMAEAMACGVPVVATETDGAREQIIDRINGFILPNNDDWLNELGYKSIKAITDMAQSDYHLLSQNATSSAQKHKLSAISHELVRIYCSLGQAYD